MKLLYLATLLALQMTRVVVTAQQLPPGWFGKMNEIFQMLNSLPQIKSITDVPGIPQIPGGIGGLFKSLNFKQPHPGIDVALYEGFWFEVARHENSRESNPRVYKDVSYGGQWNATKTVEYVSETGLMEMNRTFSLTPNDPFDINKTLEIWAMTEAAIHEDVNTKWDLFPGPNGLRFIFKFFNDLIPLGGQYWIFGVGDPVLNVARGRYEYSWSLVSNWSGTKLYVYGRKQVLASYEWNAIQSICAAQKLPCERLVLEAAPVA